MGEQIKRVRALTGVTVEQVDDATVEALLDMHDGRVYCAAADLADQRATTMIGGSGLTAVEDIAWDARRVIESWQGLADRLRARCEAEQADAIDDGPAVVEFRPYGYGAPEAVEHG